MNDARNRPVIAVVDRRFSNAAMGAVLRATRRGYHAYLATERLVEEDLELLDSLAVTVVEIECDESFESVRDRLQDRARSEGYPGILIQSDPAEPIDYQASVDNLAADETYATSAVERSSIGVQTDLLAAIPAYNEAGTIGEVVTAARRHADEVLVVDDGSQDGTAREARRAGATVVEHPVNRGYGAAMQTIFWEANRSGAHRLVVLDGDGQHSPEDIPKLIEHLADEGADLVIGSRFLGDSEGSIPLYRRFGLGVINTLTNVSMTNGDENRSISDTQSGFRAYDRLAIESLAADRSLGEDMGVSTDILRHADEHGYRIAETGIAIDYDVVGANSLNPIRHGLGLLNNLLRIIEHKRPVLALSVPGLVTILLSLGIAVWAFSNYISSGEVSIPLVVIATFSGIVGIFLILTGIVLHSVNHLYEEP